MSQEMTAPPLLNHFDAFGPRFIRVAERLGRYDTTLDDAANTMTLLGLEPGARVLDAACGFGRFAAALAEHGCDVVGVDIAPSAIAEARRRRPELRFVLGDLTRPLELGEFDAIVNVFSSFGYCETVEDEMRILRNWHAALRPGGRLLMELSDLERARHRLPLDGSTIVRDGEDGVKEHLSVEWETGMLRCRYVLRDEELTIVMRVYERADLERMLGEAGFRDIEGYGGFDGHPKEPDDRLVLVASR